MIYIPTGGLYKRSNSLHYHVSVSPAAFYAVFLSLAQKVLTGALVFSKMNCSVYSYRFGMKVGRDGFKLYLCHHLPRSPIDIVSSSLQNSFYLKQLKFCAH